MRNLKKTAILFLFSVLFSMLFLHFKSVALENNSNEINQLSVEDSSKIESFIEKQMKKGRIPGMAVVVVRGAETIYQKGFGYSELESKMNVTSETLFEIGSNSKAFTALGVLKLQSDGVINIKDPITKYIPWLKMNYKGEEVSVTIEEFMYHTSGIPFKTIDKIPISNDNDAIEKTIKTLVGIELVSFPGDHFEYATINYDVLGLLIEKVTGTTYEEYVEKFLLQPMGLKNTYLYKDKAINEDIAQGYKIKFFNPQVYDAPMYRGNKPAGYYISNAEDMAEWLKIQMNTSEVSTFDKSLIRSSHVPNRRVEPLSDGSSYASGWFIYQKGGGEISHSGSNPNFSSFIVFNPEEKSGIAILSNTNSAYVSSIGQGINEILKGNNYDKNVKDINKSADIIAVILICITISIIISTVYFMIKSIEQIIKKKRTFEKKSKKSVCRIILSLLFMMVFTYCIYLIPYILYKEVSWKFIFVWLPENIKEALYLLYISIWLVYFLWLITVIYKKDDDKSILVLSVLSIISGFGNSLIIFTINMSINNNETVKLKLLVYFILGIVLYVYGQKIMRVKLIQVTNEVVYTKRIEIVEGILKAPYDYFEKIEKGRILSTLNNDTETISRFVNTLISGITSGITLICCFIYLGFINLYALGLSIIIILIIAGIYFIVGKYANKVGEQSRDLQNIFFKFINDLIGGFKELSLNERRKAEFKFDIEKSCNSYRIKRGESALAFANMFVIGELLFILAIGAVTFVFPLILSNFASTNIASYVFILLYMTGPVHAILNTIPSFIEVKISFKRINELLNQISHGNILNLEQNSSIIESGISLKLQKVEYEYNNDGRQFKIGPIDYEFKSGEIVFITGGNGSGKSTLAKLLSGLYIPMRGTININNQEISRHALNQYFSTIFSDFYLFDKLYGINFENKERDINKYLEILQLKSKVKIENGKFSTIKLSTGQKKRLALLVTYLEDRPIYLFDEWAADQDPEFRMFFYNDLLPELKARNKCVIAITHDDVYFGLADKVLKLDMGKISNI